MEPRRTALRCPACRASLSYTPEQEATCQSCRSSYPIRHGILDLLGDPPTAVATELRGTAKESGIDFDVAGSEGVKYLPIENVETTGNLMDYSRGGPIQYYQQTTSAYLEALARSQLDSHMTVAEIGADRTLSKLKLIEDLCDEAYALNIYFHVQESTAPALKVTRVLGDMNDLPFETESLDLLIYSATLHHSSDIELALREAARVVRVGGRVIMVNEPVAGLAKSLGGSMAHDRDESIHEDDVPFRTWTRAIRRSGLVADHFVPAWFLGQLRDPSHLPQGTRFRRLGVAVAPVARHSTLGDIVRAAARVPAQALLGVPLNAVLWKVR